MKERKHLHRRLVHPIMKIDSDVLPPPIGQIEDSIQSPLPCLGDALGPGVTGQLMNGFRPSGYYLIKVTLNGQTELWFLIHLGDIGNRADLQFR